MPRIRSVHPGLFTDEAFMQASLQARLLMIGIWTECFDDGVFEWKPLTLKARIFPVDNCDLPALLSELESLNFIQAFEAGGKKYGAVRNFRKYQRPKKPTESKVLPHELRTFVALTDDISEPVGNQFGTSGEKSPQMEDGGGREGGKKDKTGAERAGSDAYAFLGKVIKLKPDDLDRWRKQYSAIPDIQAELASLDDFYASDQCSPAERKNWFIRCSKALDNRHQEAVRKRTEAAKPVAKWAI